MTIGITIRCNRTECNREFVKVTHNQKYCTRECTKVETNRRVMERYHENNAIRKGKKRQCNNCGNSLSRYNPNEECNACETSRRKDAVGIVGALMTSVAWL